MDQHARRVVLRALSYGLYAVTCGLPADTAPGVLPDDVATGGPSLPARNAFTANWLTQVSFEPPLVLLSVEQGAVSLGLIRRTRRFGVCLLPAGTRDLAARLGRSLARWPDKLDGLTWQAAPDGTPLLAGVPGWFTCRVTGELPAGDSVVLLAEVTDAGVADPSAEPLTMRAAGFRHAG